MFVPAAPSSQLLQVRLYPLNAEANQAGALQAVVMVGLNGRGSFTLAYRGHNLSGEATRVGSDFPGFGAQIGATLGENQWQVNGRRGIANAAGAGTHAQCEYVLTAPGQVEPLALSERDGVEIMAMHSPSVDGPGPVGMLSLLHAPSETVLTAYDLSQLPGKRELTTPADCASLRARLVDHWVDCLAQR